MFGSATRLMSGTNRRSALLAALTVIPFCHAGRLKKMLVPPPLPLQPVSVTVPLAVIFSVVPPTPITALSDDSYSACSGPVDP